MSTCANGAMLVLGSVAWTTGEQEDGPILVVVMIWYLPDIVDKETADESAIEG